MSNKFLAARSNIEDLLEQKKEIIRKSADLVAAVMIEENNKGETNINGIKTDVQKLLKGFSEEEKVQILEIAMAKLVANL
jgi:hypothetical protein